AEDRALLITDREQQLPVRAMVLVNDTWPVVSITPDKLMLADDEVHTITVQNTGKRLSILQVSGAAWLTVTPAELSLEPQQTGTLEIKRTKPVGELRDPRAIVLVGA